MNRSEAKNIITKELVKYRSKSYKELSEMIGKVPFSAEVNSEDGTWYQIEIEAFWDDKTHGDVRVMGSIDDGTWSAFYPVTDSFIKRPDGSFTGEPEENA